jgi:AraC family transcriptional regulator, pdu and cob operon regulator
MSINIAAKKILQDYHAILYKLTGVVIDFVSDTGEIMTLCPPEHYNPLCHYFRSVPCGVEACARADEENCTRAKATGKNIIYECHAGLIDIVVPLFVNEQYIGCLTTGQILKSPPTLKSFAEFKDKVKALNLNEDKLKEYYFATNVMSAQQIEALVELLALAGNYILESESKLLFLESVNEKKKILAARHYIEQNYQKKLTIEEIANCVFLSKSHFSHMFKKEVGISPINYLNRFRIDKAKELLQNTNNSITEIAANVGFQSLPHFNRIFKSLEKITPGLCRKSRIR